MNTPHTVYWAHGPNFSFKVAWWRDSGSHLETLGSVSAPGRASAPPPPCTTGVAATILAKGHVCLTLTHRMLKTRSVSEEKKLMRPWKVSDGEPPGLAEQNLWSLCSSLYVINEANIRLFPDYEKYFALFDIPYKSLVVSCLNSVGCGSNPTSLLDSC